MASTSLQSAQAAVEASAPVRVFTPMTLLTVLDVSLDETIAKFAATSGEISERVLRYASMSDIELIVGLQGLDRLHQELAACASILKHCVTQLSGAAKDDAAEDPIATITLADFKKRIYDRCCNDEAMLAPSGGQASF